ncbi:MAG: hypothetical protein ACJAS4_003237 [Bacteriovoracaceae bacterium]|jgi:hypothetical protein
MKFLTVMLTLLFSFSIYAVDFKIKRMSGEILVNTKKITKTTILKVGDTIQAKGKKSFIQIQNNLGSSFLIKNGIMKLVKFENDESIINLVKGKFFHYFDKKIGKGKFSVKTKHAVMGVRGTKYMIESNDKFDYLCVCEGSVAASRSKRDKTIFVNKGEDLFYYLGKKEANKQNSSDQMFSMTANEFQSMGHPIKK